MFYNVNVCRVDGSCYLYVNKISLHWVFVLTQYFKNYAFINMFMFKFV